MKIKRVVPISKKKRIYTVELSENRFIDVLDNGSDDKLLILKNEKNEMVYDEQDNYRTDTIDKLELDDISFFIKAYSSLEWFEGMSVVIIHPSADSITDATITNIKPWLDCDNNMQYTITVSYSIDDHIPRLITFSSYHEKARRTLFKCREDAEKFLSSRTIPENLFHINDTVYFINNKKICKGQISSIKRKDDGRVEYSVLNEDGSVSYMPFMPYTLALLPQECMFKSKKDAQKAFEREIIKQKEIFIKHYLLKAGDEYKSVRNNIQQVKRHIDKALNDGSISADTADKIIKMIETAVSSPEYVLDICEVMYHIDRMLNGENNAEHTNK